MHFQLMHESLARFGESFAGFLYGLNMNAFCVDFPEVCVAHYTQSKREIGSGSNITRSRVPFQNRSAAPETTKPRVRPISHPHYRRSCTHAIPGSKPQDTRGADDADNEATFMYVHKIPIPDRGMLW